MGKTRNLADLTDSINVDGSGRIGIGTTGPVSKLTIESSAQYDGLHITNGTHTIAQLIGFNTDNNYGGLKLFNSGTPTVQLQSTNGAPTYFNSGGKVGIGTTDPQQELDIQTGQLSVRAEQASAGGTGDAGAVNNLIHLRMPYSTNPATAGNAGARVGIKFTGRNDNNGWDADAGKSASIYGVSEDGGAGYNRQMGMAFYTSPFDGAQAERMRIDGNGRVTTPYQPGFYARRSIAGDGRAMGAQEWTVSGSGSYNTGNHFDASNGRFTAPVDGKYMFAAAPGYKQSGISFNFYYDINGTHMAEPVRFIGSLDSHSLASGTIIVNLSAGDYVQVYMGSTHHVNTTYNYFSGYLVG